MNLNEILIKGRFLDENGQPKGREYTYIYKRTRVVNITSAPLAAFPTFVQTAEGKKLIVTQLFTPFEEVAAFADKLKYVVDYEGEE